MTWAKDVITMGLLLSYFIFYYAGQTNVVTACKKGMWNTCEVRFVEDFL